MRIHCARSRPMALEIAKIAGVYQDFGHFPEIVESSTASADVQFGEADDPQSSPSSPSVCVPRRGESFMSAVLELSTAIDGRWLRSIRTRAAIIDAWLELIETGDLSPTAKSVA